MITTELYALAYLFAHAGTEVNDSDLRSFAGGLADFDAAMASLVESGAVTTALGGSGAVYTLSPNENGATLKSRAESAGVTPDEMLVLEEVIAAAGMAPVNRFRDEVGTAGLAAVDAHNASGFARMLALVRKRRTGSGDLIATAIRAGRISDIAASNV